MAVLQKKLTVANGQTSPNVFAGTEYEFLGRAAQITLSCVDGTSGKTAEVTWTSGSILLIDGAQFKAGTDFPVIPDNVLDAEQILPGNRNVLTFHNPQSTGSDTSIWYRLDIDFL